MIFNKNSNQSDSNLKSDEKKMNGAVSITTIPQDFYGGTDPYVSFGAGSGLNEPGSGDKKPSLIQKTKDSQIHEPMNPVSARNQIENNLKNKQSDLENANLERKNDPNSAIPEEKMRIVVPKDNKTRNVWLFVLLFLFVAGVGGFGTWYYLGNRSTEDKKEKQEIVLVPDLKPTTTTETSTITIPPVEEIPTTTTETPTATVPEFMFEFLPISFENSNDLDADSLTDEEEALFGTDPGIADTDKDTYYDGQEVANLYNPIGFTPVRILDSGLIREYADKNWNFRFYYPNQWIVAKVDVEGRETLITASNGDYVHVRVFDRSPDESFEDWFTRSIKNQLYTDLIPFVSLTKETGLKRRDDLVAYFVGPTNMYVISYHSQNLNKIVYRHVMQMLVTSFRTDAITETIEEEVFVFSKKEMLSNQFSETLTTSTDSPSSSIEENVQNSNVVSSSEQVEAGATSSVEIGDSENLNDSQITDQNPVIGENDESGQVQASESDGVIL